MSSNGPVTRNHCYVQRLLIDVMGREGNWDWEAAETLMHQKKLVNTEAFLNN